MFAPEPLPAPEILSTRRLVELLRDLQRLATRRAQREARVAEAYAKGLRDAEATREAALAEAERVFDRDRLQLESNHASERRRLTDAYEQARDRAQQQYRGLCDATQADRRRTTDQARRRQRDEAMVIHSAYEAARGEPGRRFAELEEQLKARQAELAVIERDAREILRQRRVPAPVLNTDGGADGAPGDPANPLAGRADDDPIQDLLTRVATQVLAARHGAERLYGHRLSKLLAGPVPAAGATLGSLGVGLAAGAAAGWGPGPLAGGALAGGLLGAVASWLGVRPVASRQAGALFAEVLTHAAAAKRSIQRAHSAGQQRRSRQAAALTEQRDRDLATLDAELNRIVGDMRSRTGEQLAQAGSEFPSRLSTMRDRHRAELAALDRRLEEELGEVTLRRDRQRSAAVEAALARRDRIEADREREWRELRADWLEGYEGLVESFQAIRRRCDRRFPDWSVTEYAEWDKPSEPALGVEFGRVLLDLASVKQGLPDDPRLRPAPTRIELPAMVTLREQPTLVITAEGAARRQATELLRAVMLRWITGQPPGKVRFTVLDPVGHGEAFSSFMHLADHEAGLIATRIWSEPRDIGEQLTRLTEHMETVFQKYLRSEFETIHEYNQQAGEVAEPFQVLVVNDFPAGFTEGTARRLVTLATRGPRCGVYVMMSIDGRQRPPGEAPLEDLRADAVRLDWSGERRRFVWDYPAMGRLPLRLAEPPSAERMVALLKQVGRAAKAAVRVEVPFGVVAPAPRERWARRCDGELRVPVGRAGASRVQEVRLGRGTSQHLLVAGKTGSGKSTFLHALVTSAALHYPPDEVEFYLLDFKKGVEFKSYASHRLPHARVVAIESEREFGLSVLQRLDEELSRRGELFREAGVQDLADFRATPRTPGGKSNARMPRTLLVVDEFQELFTQDDKLAQEATLLLDRLIRQGRAFGMHAVLGTQTLAGAYSIARSTLGQIAVRVALACSEADAHLILSDERNTAARFLSRPGEAIYNDQNGLLTANEPFQVVWLPDAERAGLLAELDKRRLACGAEPPPMVVFEGAAAADPAENVELRERLTRRQTQAGTPALGEAGTQRPVDRSPRRHASNCSPTSAFLGDSVAIRPPPAITFGPQVGSNLLVCGSDEASALGMLGAAAVSLAAGDRAARLTVLDATRPGDVSDGVWSRIANAAPGRIIRAGPSGVAATLGGLAAEVDRRESAPAPDDQSPSIYLIIYNAGRFRDLRRMEDDFSFSTDSGKPKSPDGLLRDIVKRGPGVGVHTLCWCDSYNAVSRAFDRVALREFALRVVTQMSPADSSNLIDTPAASQLKPNRAFFYSDETGEIVKIRPYGPPEAEWLESVGDSLR